MTDEQGPLQDLLANQAEKERRSHKRVILPVVLTALIGLVWLAFSAYKVVSLERRSSDLKNQINSQTSEISKQAGRIGDQARQIENQAQQMGDQGRQIGEQAQQIKNQAQEIKDQAQQLENETQEVEKQKAKRSELEIKTKTAREEFEKTQRKLASTKQELADAQQKLEKAASGLALAGQALENISAGKEDPKRQAASVLSTVTAANPFELPISYSEDIVSRILKNPGVPPASIWPSNLDQSKERRIVAIILHTTGSSDAVGHTLHEGIPSRGEGLPALLGPLAHWLVRSDGTIERIAAESLKATHVGQARIGITNANTIAVENSGLPAFKSERQIESLVRLVADIADRWNIPTNMIFSHAEVALPAGRKTDMLQQAPAIRQMVEAVRRRK